MDSLIPDDVWECYYREQTANFSATIQQNEKNCHFDYNNIGRLSAKIEIKRKGFIFKLFELFNTFNVYFISCCKVELLLTLTMVGIPL